MAKSVEEEIEGESLARVIQLKTVLKVVALVLECISGCVPCSIVRGLGILREGIWSVLALREGGGISVGAMLAIEVLLLLEGIAWLS